MRAFWRWHLDGAYVKINGEMHYFWDHEGEVLESFATKTRDKAAALAFMKKLMKRMAQPRPSPRMVRSYMAVKVELGNAAKQKIGRWANDRVENSHLPFRRRERAMNQYRRMKTLQMFSAVHASVHNLFNQARHLTSRETYKRDARRPTPSGGQSWAKARSGLAPCALARQVDFSLTAPAGGGVPSTASVADAAPSWSSFRASSCLIQPRPNHVLPGFQWTSVAGTGRSPVSPAGLQI
jgi:hypothetical protein